MRLVLLWSAKIQEAGLVMFAFAPSALLVIMMGCYEEKPRRWDGFMGAFPHGVGGARK